MVYEKVTSIFNTNLTLRNERTINKLIQNLWWHEMQNFLESKNNY